jgi:hypothetical protein
LTGDLQLGIGPTNPPTGAVITAITTSFANRMVAFYFFKDENVSFGSTMYLFKHLMARLQLVLYA